MVFAFFRHDMTKKNIGLLLGLAIFWGMVGTYLALLFIAKDNGKPYKISVQKGQGISAISQKLAEDNQIFSRWVFVSAAYFLGDANRLAQGTFKLPEKLSAWGALQILRAPPTGHVRIRIGEGMKWSQMRRLINQTDNIQHDTANLSDEDLWRKIAPNSPDKNPEGWFAPDSYEIDEDSSDMQIFHAAFKAMQTNLQQAWDNRAENLPYKTPYELLIMASLIEKETAHEDDRADISAVFRNRLHQKMRLQTDPTVIYGMGDAYRGKIRKTDLQRDTPYNTYTRSGLPPTPIAMPSRAALEAAAHPSDSEYLYFVSRMDDTGRSQFSHTLDEHNAAVRQYILNK